MTTITMEATSLSGKVYTFSNPVSFHYTGCRDNICDTVSAEFYAGHLYDELVSVKIYMNGSLFYTGYVDAFTSIYDQKGQRLSIECRNQYALLEDNEPLPGNRPSLTVTDLYNQFGKDTLFGKDFGIKGIQFSSSPTVKDFDIKDTYTNWDVINHFCLRAFLREAWINPSGYVVDKVNTGNSLLFSNTKSGGKEYISMAMQKKRKNLVYVANCSVRESTYQFARMDAEVHSLGITNQQYFTAESFWNNAAGFDASAAFLNRRKKDRLLVELRSNGFQLDKVGDTAAYQDGDISISNMYVYQLELIHGAGGQFTKYTLYQKP